MAVTGEFGPLTDNFPKLTWASRSANLCHIRGRYVDISGTQKRPEVCGKSRLIVNVNISESLRCLGTYYKNERQPRENEAAYIECEPHFSIHLNDTDSRNISDGYTRVLHVHLQNGAFL